MSSSSFALQSHERRSLLSASIWCGTDYPQSEMDNSSRLSLALILIWLVSLCLDAFALFIVLNSLLLGLSRLKQEPSIDLLVFSLVVAAPGSGMETHGSVNLGFDVCCLLFWWEEVFKEGVVVSQRILNGLNMLGCAWQKRWSLDPLVVWDFNRWTEHLVLRGAVFENADWVLSGFSLCQWINLLNSWHHWLFTKLIRSFRIIGLRFLAWHD